MLYLFDLDDTLVKTDDLSEIRLVGKNNNSQEYIKSLNAALNARPDRMIWSEEQIQRFFRNRPLSNSEQNYLGIFTRAPRSYCKEILGRYYPNIKWDTVVCYEDCAPYTKPHGYGINLARQAVKQQSVFVIGDSEVDIQAAYHAVCYAAWDSRRKSEKFDYRTYDLLPDFVYDDVDQFVSDMSKADRKVMALEADELTLSLNFEEIASNTRSVAFFCPERKRYLATVFGRHFSGYQPLLEMRKYHSLTKQIEDHKDAEVFPAEWVEALIAFCQGQERYFGRKRPNGRVVLTCIPARPGRRDRLGALVQQCAREYEAAGSGRLVFRSNIFCFKAEVRSNSREYLSKDERFENIYKNLKLNDNIDVNSDDTIVVFDDVVTTGSSLIGADKLLRGLGISYIQLVALSKNISNIMPERWKNEVVNVPEE